MADLSSARGVWELVRGPFHRGIRAYRRRRWKYRAGWGAGTGRKAPRPDVILIALGNHQIRPALWEVHGPAGEYFLPLPEATAMVLAQEFPASGFRDRKGVQPAWEGLPHGRYWAILLAWEDDDRVPVCRVPFRIYEGTAQLIRRYEAWYIRRWERHHPPPPMPDSPPTDQQSP